jgi:hypothetical protein
MPPGAAAPIAWTPTRRPGTWSGGSLLSASAGHSVARIARALNESGVSCPSAAHPERNSHRRVTGWTLGAVTTILQNPRYSGH